MFAAIFGLPQLVLLLALIITHFNYNSEELKEKYNLNGYLVTHVFNTVLITYLVLWLAALLLPVAFLLPWVNFALDVIAIVWLWQSWKDGKVLLWWADAKALYTVVSTAIKSKFSK